MTNFAFNIDNTNPDDTISPYLFPIKKNNKWGYINRDGKIVIEPRFDHADEFHDGFAVVRMDTGSESDTNSNAVIGTVRSDSLRFKHGKHKYGFINHRGEYIIKPVYDYADRFSEGLAMVLVGNSDTGVYGYVNATGKVVIEPKYPYIGFTRDDLNFSDGLAPVKIDRKIAFIDFRGEIAFKTNYDHAWQFSEGMAAVRKGLVNTGRYGYIDNTGNTVIDPKLLGALPFREGLAGVRIEGWAKHIWGFIDKSGGFAIKPVYMEVFSFHNGLARTWTGDLVTPFLAILSSVPFDPRISGTIRFITKDRIKALTLRNGFVGDFHEGLAIRQLGGCYFYINKFGETVIDSKFENAKDFKNGLAMVQVDGKWGYIDRTGKWVLKPGE
jgi:hypothetical protein